MIYKQAQIDKFLKRPDNSLRAVLVYGSNEGLMAEQVKNFTKAICDDVNDPFRVAYLNGADVNADPGILFGEYGSQSLMGGRRVIVVRDADNNLTKNLKSLFETTKSDALLIISSGSLNKKSSLVKLGEDSEDMAVIPCYEDRDEDIYGAARTKFVEGGYTIGNEALQILCARLSNDRKSSMGEIDKLMTYMGDRKNITTEDVVAIISDNSASTADDVCYYVAGGQTEKALASFTKLLNEGSEPISIIRNVTYHFNKLMTYMGDRKNITTEDVVAIISDNSASTADDVCYYVAGGQTEKALASFTKLLNEGSEPISIIRNVTYHFNKLLTCLGMVEQGETVDKALMRLTPPIIFFRKSSFKMQVSLWPKERLFSVLELLYKCERDCKSTNMPVEEIVSYTLMQIGSAAAKLNRRGY